MRKSMPSKSQCAMNITKEQQKKNAFKPTSERASYKKSGCSLCNKKPLTTITFEKKVRRSLPSTIYDLALEKNSSQFLSS